MTQLLLYSLLGIFIAIGIWQFVVWISETIDKNRKFQEASNFATTQDKPLLVVGGPWGKKPARRWLNIPAHGNGDVCLDIDRRAINSHPCGIIANITHIPLSDKSFGSAFTSHLLEHLPTNKDAKKALDELNRVAERVFIVCPSRQSIAGWVIADHHLRVWQDRGKIYFQQRGKSKVKEEYTIEA